MNGYTTPWTVMCVLRTGGCFKEEHAASLREQVAKHFQNPHEFVCLTNLCRCSGATMPLVNLWKGWWSKLETFEYQVAFGRPALYIDLDTVITGDFGFESVPGDGELWLLKDFVNWGKTDKLALERKWATGLYAWNTDLSYICRNMENGDVDSLQKRWAWDQAWVQHQITASGGVLSPLNDHLALESYKVSGLHNKRPAEGTQIVCFHGNPRPWDTFVAPWVKEIRDGIANN